MSNVEQGISNVEVGAERFFTTRYRQRPEAQPKVLSVYPKEMTEGNAKLRRESEGKTFSSQRFQTLEN